MSDPIQEAELRGRTEERLRMLEEHKRHVNGSLDEIKGEIGGLRSSFGEALAEIKASLAATAAEKKGIVNLQNRQIAFMAAIATAIYLLVEHVH